MTQIKHDFKILGVIDEDPFDPRTWSGSSNYFFSSLKKIGILYDAISAHPNRLLMNWYKIINFHPNINIWKHKYHMDTKFYNTMTKIALNKIAKHKNNNYDAVLQIGAWYDLTKHKNKLHLSYHDANLFTLVNSPTGLSIKNRNFVKKCINYEKNVYKKIDIIFTMGKWLANSFIYEFGVDRNKVINVGAGINLPYTKKIENKTYDEPKILFIGKVFERKGGKYLLEAFKIVKQEIHNAELTLIGPNINNPPDGVKCLGFISKNNKNGLTRILSEYSKATLFVMPSIYEPFGIVFLEAMAHKLPCIGSNTCAMPEIIQNGKTGYIVPVGDSKALADKIIRIIKNPELAKKFGESGYMHFQNNFTWEKVAEKIKNAISVNI